MKNIFIEGMQGSGKTTLMKSLHEKLDGYRMYLEGDISPIELSWCSYMTTGEYQQAIEQFPQLASEIEKHSAEEEDHIIVAYTRIMTEITAFYHYMENYEIYNGRRSFLDFKDLIFRRLERFQDNGNLFECSLFQNIIEELLLYFCMTEDEIISFYKEIYQVIRQKNVTLIYLCSDDLERDILRIKKERTDENGTEIWYALMLNYLNESPYGKRFAFESISDVIKHFQVRMAVELRIMKEIMGEHSIIIPAKAYDIDDVLNKIKGVRQYV